MKYCPDCLDRFKDELERCPHDGTVLRRERGKADPLIGTLLEGRFQILQRLGEGGMASVYKATQLSVGRPVALKLLKQEYSTNQVAVSRFMREASLASKLSHPHTITILDFGQSSEGTLYLAMEYVPGMALSDLIDSAGHLPVARACRIIVQVCDSLSEAHGLGIIHRDLKPANIHICEQHGKQDFVKVLDFGIAKAEVLTSETDTPLTQPGTICGTPAYLSPEQVESQAVDARSDIYSVGVIFYEMLTGQPPFMDDSPIGVMMKHIRKSPPSISRCYPQVDVPEQIEQVVMKCLRKQPGDRYQTTGALKQDIETALKDSRSDGRRGEGVSREEEGHEPAGAASDPVPKTGEMPSHSQGTLRFTGREVRQALTEAGMSSGTPAKEQPAGAADVPAAKAKTDDSGKAERPPALSPQEAQRSRALAGHPAGSPKSSAAEVRRRRARASTVKLAETIDLDGAQAVERVGSAADRKTGGPAASAAEARRRRAGAPTVRVAEIIDLETASQLDLRDHLRDVAVAEDVSDAVVDCDAHTVVEAPDRKDTVEDIDPGDFRDAASWMDHPVAGVRRTEDSDAAGAEASWEDDSSARNGQEQPGVWTRATSPDLFPDVATVVAETEDAQQKRSRMRDTGEDLACDIPTVIGRPEEVEDLPAELVERDVPATPEGTELESAPGEAEPAEGGEPSVKRARAFAPPEEVTTAEIVDVPTDPGKAPVVPADPSAARPVQPATPFPPTEEMTTTQRSLRRVRARRTTTLIVGVLLLLALLLAFWLRFW